MQVLKAPEWKQLEAARQKDRIDALIMLTKMDLRLAMAVAMEGVSLQEKERLWRERRPVGQGASSSSSSPPSSKAK